ncbi:MAG: serine hydrolase domain-containing protein [Chloroflexota bacterium]
MSAGLTKSRLDRMREVLSGYVERGDLPGLVTLVSHNDDLHVEALGTLAFGDPRPMQRDTIFRIASITKLMTAVATMILVEECKLRLDESIDDWLPELANRRVLKSLASEIDDTVPANRAITLRDLLTFTMGFGSIMAMPDTYPIQKYIRDYGIGGDSPPHPAQTPATDQWIANLGKLPLIAQPGERWMYNVSADVLGVLIARVAGQSFGDFLRQRIFDPLGMKDTAFFVPPDQLARLPVQYAFDSQIQTITVFDDVANSDWRQPPPFEAGSAGLVSTVDDFFAFSRMMLNKGRHGSTQILARATVELMTSDQLTPEQRIGADIFFGGYSSWGLGMAVETRSDEIYHHPGRFGWEGGFGTSARTDPANGMIGLLFSQRMMDSPASPKLYNNFWTLAYAAME